MPDRPSSAPDQAAPPADPKDRATLVLLRMLHNARNRGDRAAAEAIWQKILVAEIERVRGMVRQMSSSALPDGKVPAGDVDDITTDVFLRLHAVSETLDGRSLGELRNFLRTATKFTFLDYLRRYVRDHEQRAGSIDADPDSKGRAETDRLLARLADRLTADDEDAMLAREVVHPALAMVDDDKRIVIVMSVMGATTEEIMERVGISRDVVYQRRRRGHKQLHDAILELAGEDESA